MSLLGEPRHAGLLWCDIVLWQKKIPHSSVHTSPGKKMPMVEIARESFLTANSAWISVRSKT